MVRKPNVAPLHKDPRCYFSYYRVMIYGDSRKGRQSPPHSSSLCLVQYTRIVLLFVIESITKWPEFLILTLHAFLGFAFIAELASFALHTWQFMSCGDTIHRNRMCRLLVDSRYARYCSRLWDFLLFLRLCAICLFALHCLCAFAKALVCFIPFVVFDSTLVSDSRWT